MLFIFLSINLKNRNLIYLCFINKKIELTKENKINNLNEI